ncbi:hypothetical protein GF312_04560 [Candidatus Poribacteria bacterium]|nr:hypothetical protein [Candidatus Poribacteria bacterium]
MRSRFLLIFAFLVGLMIVFVGCDTEESSPVLAEQPTETVAAAPSMFKLHRLARSIERNKFDSIQLGAVAVDDPVELDAAADNASFSLRALDLVDQYPGNDTIELTRTYSVGDDFYMTLWFNARYRGTVKCLFLWIGDDTIVWPPSENQLWWEKYVDTPGITRMSIQLPGGAPNLPGTYYFMGAVKYSIGGLIPWRREWGWNSPEPNWFSITAD